MDRVRQDTGKCVRGREVVAEAADGVGSAATIMPHAQKIHEEVTGELNRQHLNWLRVKESCSGRELHSD